MTSELGLPLTSCAGKMAALFADQKGGALMTKKIDLVGLTKNGNVLSLGKAENFEDAKQAARIYMNAHVERGAKRFRVILTRHQLVAFLDAEKHKPN